MFRTFDEKKNITENINSAFMKLENFFFHFGPSWIQSEILVRRFKNSRHVVKSLFSLLWIITFERRLTSDRNHKGMKKKARK